MSTAPFQVEELIATLNSTNIGTEALELARLQAQLQQALQAYPQGAPFPTSPVQSMPIHNCGAPANTPTARTPSSSSWMQCSDANHGRKRRRGSVASARSSHTIREEDEDRWRQDEEQDFMEDVDEEAQVDASLYFAASPVQFSHSSGSPLYGSSPTSYASTDPFLAHQLQAAEQRNRQPSFFAQVATAQQHTSPFYIAAAGHSQPSQHGSPFEPESQLSRPLVRPLESRPMRHPLTIDTGLKCVPVDATWTH